MQGFYNRLLDVDLSAGRFEIREISDETLRPVLGGKGLATRLLLDHNPPGVDPLAPENRLIFATGPVCNGPVWGGSRYGVYTKSPLTGLYCESYAGGKTPEAIDACGFDAIMLHGRAETPTALTVTPGGVEFHDASDMWGMDCFRTEDEARARFSGTGPGRAGAVVIGPAAENGVRFSVISNDYWRQAGRAGAGTVMGDKRVKAIVFRGDRKRVPARPEELKAHAKAFLQEGKDLPGVKAYKAQGTTMMVAIMNTAKAFPAKYWTQGTCDHWENLSGEAYHKEHEVKAKACAKCFMACGRMAEIRTGRHKGLKLEGPEYETIYAFGGLCMVTDMAEIAHFNDLCDRLGMDTITAGNLVALAMEAKATGILDDGPEYGDVEAITALLQDMAEGRGLGKVLRQGIVPAAKTLGMADQAVHVKGMEPPGYDPRVLKGMGLAYATSDRGACHLRTTFYKPELAGMSPPDQMEGKAEILIDFEDRLTLFDCLILCRFYRDMYTWDKLAETVALVTGLDLDQDELRAVGRRVTELAREFNLREGMTPDADTLPERFFTPLASGETLTREEFATMLSDYYALKGWSK